jgi:hypothetical protein
MAIERQKEVSGTGGAGGSGARVALGALVLLGACSNGHPGTAPDASAGGAGGRGGGEAGRAGGVDAAAGTTTSSAGTGGNDAGLSDAGDVAALDPTTTYQAETAFYSGGAALSASAAGFTGTGYVTGFSKLNAQVIFAVNAPSSGAYEVTLRYASGGPSATLTIAVNGYSLKSTSLAATGAAGSWGTKTDSLALRAGLNTIGYRREPADPVAAAIDVDALVVRGALPLANRGATLPYVELEAEAAVTTGTKLTASRQYLTLAAEASGRQAVVLDKTGQQVSFTLSAAANALVVRYSIPDTSDGVGQDATLGLYAGETKLQDIPLSSRYAWIYGDYPFLSAPEAGSAHRFFDEARARMPEQPAGTVLSLRKDAASTAASYTLDLVDLEEVAPPFAMPSFGFLSITSQGAIANDGLDDTVAIEATLHAAQIAHQQVFIPAGTFDVSRFINVGDITVAGAGAWHSVLRGKNAHGGIFVDTGVVKLLDFAIVGDVRARLDNTSDSGIEGKFADGSIIQGLWIEHTKTGLWVTDAATTGLYAVGLRIRDTFADGVNLFDGPSNVRVDQSSLRNTGDDALAMWSNGTADTDCAFTFDTVQLPMLANGVGLYGGRNNRVEDNLIADTVTGGAGIAVSTRFGNVGFSGTQLVQRNTLVRAGGYEPNWKTELGALWLFASPEMARDITTPVVVRDLEITDSTSQGILLSASPRTISGATFEGVTVRGTGSYGIDLEASGSATFTGVAVSGAGKAPLNNPSGFTVQGSSNVGF